MKLRTRLISIVLLPCLAFLTIVAADIIHLVEQRQTADKVLVAADNATADFLNEAGSSLVSGSTGGVIPREWFDASTAYIEEIKVLEDNVGLHLAEEATAQISTIEQTMAWEIVIFGIILIMTSAIIYVMSRNLVKAMHAIRDDIGRVAGGTYDFSVSGTTRKDEIGEIAQSLMTMRDTLQQSDAEQAASTQAREIAEAAQHKVVTSLSSALASASAGEMGTRINQSLASDYEELRRNFNSTMESLQDALHAVIASSESVQGSAGEISESASSLSQRTENQAAALEETAAALEQLTASVQSTASGAQQADQFVSKTMFEAEANGNVITETVEAMGRIQRSSNEISKIVSMIEDIAFQTNLLALNAGVEAARAGQAGRGFAVVASEIRALAQRSSDAAQEIKTLIASSANEVEIGAGLVEKTGKAMTGVVSMVSKINMLVSEISNAASEQSEGLSEIARSVSQLDQVTQKNATMVEETTTAGQILTRDAKHPISSMSRFTFGSATQMRGASGSLAVG